MIVLEGPDGAGKTTLANYLFDKLNLDINPKVVNHQAGHDNSLKEVIESTLDKNFQMRIWDRFALISGPIYADLLQDKYQMNLYADKTWHELQWRKMTFIVRPIVIMCLPPVTTVISNIRDDPENEVVLPHITEIWIRYQKVFFSMPEAIHYDYRQKFAKERVLGKVYDELIARGMV